MTTTFDTLPDTLGLVASAASPVHADHVIDVGAAPINVPSKRLAAALAADEFRLARSATLVSPTAWAPVAEFADRHCGGLLFEAEQPSAASAFCRVDGEALVVIERQDGYRVTWTVTAAANSRAAASKWIAAFAKLLPGYPPPPPPPERPHDVIPVRFWMQDSHSGEAYSRTRDINVTDWSDVEANYAAEPRERLAALAAMRNPQGGKLILLHGPPGTGKTRSILALLSEWRDWCTASVVTDTDRFFGDPTYINSLVFNSVGMANWMVLVLEDADDYLAVSGKANKGQSISRLLNLADGIVGQGINLLTLMTTNVDVDELNPAVTRNGRCLANVEVGPFPGEEAAKWLAARGVDAEAGDAMTLADMYAAVNATR